MINMRLFLLFEQPYHFLFVAVISDLIEQGRLSGTIQGRQDKANFVPEVYSRTQNAWVDAFYQQNGYLGKYVIKM